VDAIKILQCEILVSPKLNRGLTKKLQNQLRGPFAKGMTQEQAVKVIDAMGWRVKDETK
jgi:hypothetical protein